MSHALWFLGLALILNYLKTPFREPMRSNNPIIQGPSALIMIVLSLATFLSFWYSVILFLIWFVWLY